MQRLEVSCAVRRIYTSQGAQGLTFAVTTKSNSPRVELVLPTVRFGRL